MAVTHTLKPGPASPPPLRAQAGSPSRGHRRTPCSPRPAPPHGETGVPPVLPGRLPLTGRPEYPVLPGRLPLTGRPAYTSLLGIVQPDELLMLSHDGELNLGEVRQAAPEAEKPI